MLPSLEAEKEALFKEAAENMREAARILAEETVKEAAGSGVDVVAQAKQASLTRIFANLKYVDLANALLGQ